MKNAIAPETSLSQGGKLVAFVALIRGLNVPCSITRLALEAHFWVPPRADEARLQKAIVDGRNRITAVVERKMLKASGRAITLREIDFKY